LGLVVRAFVALGFGEAARALGALGAAGAAGAAASTAAVTALVAGSSTAATPIVLERVRWHVSHVTTVRTNVPS